MAVEKDPFQDMKDQFKGMKESLDEIAKHTKPVEEVAKAQISHAHKTTQPVAKVDLGKQTKKEILDALKNIRNQIVVTQHRESTMADVAAEALASGQSLAGAAKQALTFKKDRLKASFKRKFDPLNIIHRITGGSKLATALAGKVMGRSEQSIRSAAGLQPLSEPAPMPFMGDQGGAPSPVTSDQSTTLLQNIASTLTEIRDGIASLSATNKGIEEEIDEQTTKLEKMHDEEKDAASIAGVESEAPVQIVGGKEVKKEEGGSWLSAIAKMLGPAMLPLLTAFGLLVTAAVLVYKNFEKIKLSLSLLGDSITDLWDGIKNFVSSIGTWISDAYTSISDSVLDAGESLLESIKSLNPFYTAPTEEEKRKDLETRASGGDERAQRKLRSIGATPAQTTATVSKLAPQSAEKLMSKNLPADKLALEAQELRKGGYTQDAMSALSGKKPITGSPERIAVGGALTQMVGKAYGELHKDEKGNPLSPSRDTEENRAKFLPPLIQEASTKLAESITAPGAGQMVPSMTAPTEIPAPAPTSGQTLSQAADAQRNAAVSSTSGTVAGGSTIINNIKNNNTNSSTVHQIMAPARSEESSYLRSLDSAHARS